MQHILTCHVVKGGKFQCFIRTWGRTSPQLPPCSSAQLGERPPLMLAGGSAPDVTIFIRLCNALENRLATNQRGSFGSFRQCILMSVVHLDGQPIVCLPAVWGQRGRCGPALASETLHSIFRLSFTVLSMTLLRYALTLRSMRTCSLLLTFAAVSGVICASGDRSKRSKSDIAAKCAIKFQTVNLSTHIPDCRG